MKLSELKPPAGMYGLAVEPWNSGEFYAVAANWAQANSPVLVWGDDEWINEPRGRHVADFRHMPEKALLAQLTDAIAASGETDNRDTEQIVYDAICIGYGE